MTLSEASALRSPSGAYQRGAHAYPSLVRDRTRRGGSGRRSLGALKGSGSTSALDAMASSSNATYRRAMRSDLMSQRQAAELLHESGLSRRQAHELLRAGLAGSPVRTGGLCLYDRSVVEGLVGRPLLGRRSLDALCPHGVFVSRRTLDLDSDPDLELEGRITRPGRGSSPRGRTGSGPGLVGSGRLAGGHAGKRRAHAARRRSQRPTATITTPASAHPAIASTR